MIRAAPGIPKAVAGRTELEKAVFKKRGISSTFRRAPPPPCTGTAPGSRLIPPMKRDPGPSTSARMPTAHKQLEKYSGDEPPPAEEAPSFPNFRPPCLCRSRNRECVRVRRNPARGSNIMRFPCRFNGENSAGHHFIRRSSAFFRPVQVCCTSFAGKTGRQKETERTRGRSQKHVE